MKKMPIIKPKINSKHRSFIGINNDDLFVEYSKTAKCRNKYIIGIRNIKDPSNINALLDTKVFNEPDLELIEKNHLLILCPILRDASDLYTALLKADKNCCISMFRNGKIKISNYNYWRENVLLYDEDAEEDEEDEEEGGFNIEDQGPAPLYITDKDIKNVKALEPECRTVLIKAGWTSASALLMAGWKVIAQIPGIPSEKYARHIYEILDAEFEDVEDEVDEKKEEVEDVECEFDKTY